MSGVMTFPATFEEFAKTYKIVDSEQIYTNGTELIPIFRVEQWLEHKSTLNLTDKDKDIIKALELCFAEKGTKQTCGECPYHQFGELCKVKRGRDTLDLINRQQAENDNWEKQFRILDVECSRLEKKTEEQQAEIERLKKQHRLNLLEQLDIAEQIKAEAIKEFAERLKEKQQTFTGDEYVYKFIYLIEIDNLVKEMVGEE